MYRIHPSQQVEEVAIQLPPLPHLTLSSESIYFSPIHTTSTKCKFFCDAYQKRLIVGISGLIIGLIVILAMSAPTVTSDNPCISYRSEDTANTVSMTCFRYMWKKTCVEEMPAEYDGGWWLRSPRGGTMVSCVSSYQEKTCGAGSYRTLVTYLYHCSLTYDGK